MSLRWKLIVYRCPHAEDATTCQAPGCKSMATYWCVKSAKAQQTERTARCTDHARTIADRSKLSVEGLT